MDETAERLVNENYLLIQWFLSKNHFDDEYYHYAALGLMKAAEAYKGKTKFSTFASVCMKNECAKHFKILNAKKRKGKNPDIRLDAARSDSDINLYNCIGGGRLTEEIALGNEMACYILNLIKNWKESNYKIVLLVINGYSKEEIAKMLGCTKQNVFRVIKQTRIFLTEKKIWREENEKRILRKVRCGNQNTCGR